MHHAAAASMELSHNYDTRIHSGKKNASNATAQPESRPDSPSQQSTPAQVVHQQPLGTNGRLEISDHPDHAALPLLLSNAYCFW